MNSISATENFENSISSLALQPASSSIHLAQSAKATETEQKTDQFLFSSEAKKALAQASELYTKAANQSSAVNIFTGQHSAGATFVLDQSSYTEKEPQLSKLSWNRDGTYRLRAPAYQPYGLAQYASSFGAAQINQRHGTMLYAQMQGSAHLQNALGSGISLRV